MRHDDLTEDETAARKGIAVIRDMFSDLPLARRNMILLLVSAGLAENAAYDLARADPPELTASILLAAAALERHAERQRRRSYALDERTSRAI
jgi:hypothetical protein